MFIFVLSNTHLPCKWLYGYFKQYFQTWWCSCLHFDISWSNIHQQILAWTIYTIRKSIANEQHLLSPPNIWLNRSSQQVSWNVIVMYCIQKETPVDTMVTYGKLWYNMTYHEATKMTPYEVTYVQQPPFCGFIFARYFQCTCNRYFSL